MLIQESLTKELHSLLHVAIEAGHTQVVSELLSAGADTSIQADGMTPMDFARIISDENRNWDEIIELLEKSA